MTAPDPLPPPPDPALCDRIPLGLRMAVEIGCGNGEVGAWLARRDPLCRRIATEADPRLAALATPHYEAVHLLPPEQGAPLAAGCADLVILRGRPQDPGAAMDAAARLLSPDGTLLIDLPNAGHWRIAARLLAGDAVAAAPGAVTRASLMNALEASGLIALDGPTDTPALAEARAFAEQVAATLGGDVEAFLRRAAPPRWLLRAARRPPRPLALLAHVLKPVGGVNDVRVDVPLGAVASRPGILLRTGRQPETPRLPEDAPRVLVLHRRLLNAPQAPAFVQHFRKAGWVIVQEFDDDPAHWPEIAASGHFAFRGVHAVQTTTPRLASLFREFNEDVEVFPNTVAELPVPANFADPSRLTLFLGALRREADLAPYLPALNEVLAEADGRLAVEVVFDRTGFDALDTPHKRFHPLLPYAAYRRLMAGCELAFLPLNDTRFNGFKSDLKFVEAASHGLCCLASPVVYGATIRDGETGLILHDPGQFAAMLRALLADPSRARSIGAAAREWVGRNRMAASQAPARLAWYDGLWDRRAALDAALLRRAPEIAALAV